MHFFFSISPILCLLSHGTSTTSLAHGTTNFFQEILHHQPWSTVFQPFTTTSFAPQWHQQPLLYRNNNNPSPTALNTQRQAMFQLQDLDPLLYSSCSISKDGTFNKGIPPTSPNDFSVVKLTQGKQGEWWAGTFPMPTLNVEQASTATHHGFSLIFNKVDERWTNIHVATKQLEHITGNRVGTNLYLTPPISQGFESHFDYMDVFVVQMQGSKHWRIYNPPFIVAPRLDQKFSPTKSDLKNKTYCDIVVKEGDVLYIPSGWTHDARVKDMLQPSLHLSFGVEVDVAFRWEGLLHQGIKLKFQHNDSNNVVHDESHEYFQMFRMLCHSAISLLATQATTPNVFGLAMPSRRSTLLLPTSSAWSKHVQAIETTIVAQTQTLTVPNITLHWQNRIVLVEACWRGGRHASEEVDSTLNGGPPPPLNVSILSRITAMKVVEQLVAMVQDQDLMKKAVEQVEQEFIRRSSHTNNNRNYNLQQHEKKRDLLFATTTKIGRMEL